MGVGSLYRRGQIWWIKYYPAGRGKAERESTHTTSEKEARRMLRARLEESGRSNFIGKAEDRITFDDLFAELEADYKANKRRSLAAIYVRRKPLKAFFGRMRAIEITSRHIAEYKRQRAADGKANGTINRELAALKRMFKLGVKNGLISSAPGIGMLDEAPPREGFLTKGDFLAVQEHLPEDLRDFAGFLYRSGWRIGEARKLEWSDVDLEADEITLRSVNSKNKKPRLLALDGELRAIIDRAAVCRRPGTPVFWMDRYHRTGESVRPQPIGRFDKTWKRACRAAGLPGLIVHDFRRSAVRNYTRARAPEAVVMAITGHKTRSVFDRYNITSTEDIRTAVNSLDRYLDGLPAESKIVPLRKAGQR
jgi:integrase